MGQVGIFQLLIILVAAYFIVVWWRKRKSGFGGVSGAEDLQPSGDPTRYALASLYLQGAAFRQKLLDRDEHPTRAFAPEKGLDYGLVLAACRSIHKSEMVMDMTIGVLAFLTLVSGFFYFVAYGFFNPVTFFYWMFIPFQFTFFHLLFYSLLIITLVKLWQDRFRKVQPFLRKNYDEAALREKYGVGSQATAGYPANGNIICYGSTNPFVGSGYQLRGWQITTRLIPHEHSDKPPVPMDSQSVHDDLTEAVGSIGLGNLRQRDVLFLNGTEIGQVATSSDVFRKLFLPDPYARPLAHFPQNGFQHVRSKTDDRLRAYKEVELQGWRGELVFNSYIRATVEGSTLTVEVAPTFLPPVDRKYREIDTLRDNGFWGNILWFFGALVRIPFAWLGSVRVMFTRLAKFIGELFTSRLRKEKKEIDRNPAYNYGAVNTIRGVIAAANPHFYFQEADILRSKNLLERVVMDAIVHSLAKNGYSTADFEKQSVFVTDNSVKIEAGGDVDVSGAIGKGASAVMSRVAGASGGKKG